MKDIETESLEAHVALCEQRYKALELRLESVETKVDGIRKTIDSIKDTIIRTAFAIGISIIAALCATVWAIKI